VTDRIERTAGGHRITRSLLLQAIDARTTL